MSSRRSTLISSTFIKEMNGFPDRPFLYNIFRSMNRKSVKSFSFFLFDHPLAQSNQFRIIFIEWICKQVKSCLCRICFIEDKTILLHNPALYTQILLNRFRNSANHFLMFNQHTDRTKEVLSL